MSAPLVILCYHRVLPETERAGAGRPYFTRGTAVSEQTFSAQMRAVAERFDVLSEPEVLAWRRGERELSRPSCWITFDDGYRDVIERAVPTLARLGLPATVFVTTGLLGDPTRWLPADLWYAVLSRATRTRGVMRGVDGERVIVDLTADHGRWVDGPERRNYLRASAVEQRRTIGELAEALRAALPEVPELYLSATDLIALKRLRWTVGGHGHTHAILPRISSDDLLREVVAPRETLSALGLTPRVFAHPDGAHDARVAAATSAAGWDVALALEGRPANRSDHSLALPRFIPPDDPHWIEQHL